MFPITKSYSGYKDPLVKNVADDDKRSNKMKDDKDLTTISWREIKAIWKQAVKGTDDEKIEAVDDLARFYENRFSCVPDDDDHLRETAWKTIAREAIIHKFTTKSGLQLKLTGNHEFIYCRVRAPMKLLELQADKDNYALQFKGEIDPGSAEFWNLTIKGKGAIELEEEKRTLTKDEANIILEKLYRAGKIPPSDLGVNTMRENEKAFTRRVHALERIADKVPVWNRYPAYAQFSSEPQNRYLYQTYQSVRGKTLFRAKDRLYLTKAVMDRFFDVEVFVTNNVVHSILALHDANRGEKITIDVLLRRWVYFWRASAREAGAPYVTHYAYDESEEVWWYWRLFAQPLSDIRDYFGEKIAMYYSWLGFYTVFMIVPALIGVGMIVVYATRGFVDTVDHIDWFLCGFTITIVVWSSMYKVSWDREVECIQIKWGLKGYEEEEKDRPQFKGDENTNNRSLVNNQLEATFPAETRRLYIIGSWGVLSVIISILLSLIGSLFYLEYLVDYEWTSIEFNHFSWVVAAIQAIIIQVNTALYNPFARMLNDNENHKTETSYEDVLIQKLLVFQLFNNFAALAFTSFAKDAVFGNCNIYGCMYDLRVLLIAVVVARFFADFFTMGWPYFKSKISDIFGYNGESKNLGMANAEEVQQLNAEPDDDLQFMDEVNRNPFHGTLNSYADTVVQYGFVNWYTMALPVLGLFALFENMFKLRMEAWKLCVYTRRPHVLLGEDMHMWSSLMDMMAYAGCVNSVAVLVFTSSSFDEYTFVHKVILFLVTEQVLVLFKLLMNIIIPSDTAFTKMLLKRQDFITKKFLMGFDDDDDALSLNDLKGNLTDFEENVVESLNLYDIRKAKQFTEKDYEMMEALESKRRDLLGETRLAKGQLQRVHKSEVLNEQTGIGETKHGLPLGRLSVKLVNIEGLDIEALGYSESDDKFKLRVNIVSTSKVVAQAGPPISDKSYCTQFMFKDGDSQFAKGNIQNLGPFAPIRTFDAEIHLEIMETKKDAIVAKCIVPLRDLSEQVPQQKTLYAKVQSGTTWVPSECKIHVELFFQYSKIVPLRNKIYEITDRLRETEKQLALIKAGKLTA